MSAVLPVILGTLGAVAYLVFGFFFTRGFLREGAHLRVREWSDGVAALCLGIIWPLVAAVALLGLLLMLVGRLGVRIFGERCP